MKKLISIKDLRVGMFIDAEAVTDEKDGEEFKYLSAVNSTGTGSTGKRARLTGRMHQKIESDGGLLIASDNMIASLASTGLSMVTIDTEKGDDLPENAKPLTDPNRKPPPEGRLVHYDEEIEKAKEVRDETTDTLKNALSDVAEGKEMDVERVQEAGGIISDSILRNVDAMVSLTRIKKHDPYTAMHCMNVCTLVTAMAMHNGTEPAMLPMITSAALLHDVGKTRVPLEILNKPGRFEPHELQEMRKHATYSGDIMREDGSFSQEQIAIAEQHHEMLDGSGYPQGLSGDAIHYFARLTAVADVYDALTAKRVYKPAMPMYQALLRIHKNKGAEFDEDVVDLFVKTLGLYPVGSLVEINTGEQAVVFEPNPTDSRKPVVALLTQPNKKPRSAPYVMSLAVRSQADGREITKVMDPEKSGIDVEKIMTDVEQRGERTDRKVRG
ncbi:MAG: HD-GYP domain-containing protein [Candidatus Latescibacteria bacterium]|jgi:HD-GYP domain-containing protein (c-di-GMP phosphodiesterase class II)|nr:HD-GYP domain-containing protein [Candidatus Latescibacterota bacterium]